MATYRVVLTADVMAVAVYHADVEAWSEAEAVEKAKMVALSAPLYAYDVELSCAHFWPDGDSPQLEAVSIELEDAK